MSDEPRLLEDLMRQAAEHGLTVEQAATEAAEDATARARATGVDARYETIYDVAGVAVASAVTGIPAPLLQIALGGETPAVTVRLRRLQRRAPSTRLIERNLAVAPLFAPPVRGQAVQLSLELVESLHGARATIFAAKGLPTIRGMLLMAEVASRYVAAGCPPSRVVPFSLTEAAEEWMGYEQVGGRERQIVKGELTRWRHLVINSRLRLPGNVLVETEWGLIDRWQTASRGHGPGKGWVRLSEEMARLLAAGSATFMDGDILRALVQENELAARLWVYLEAEGGPERPAGWRYSLWAAPAGQAPREDHWPSVAEFCLITDTKRRRVVAKLRHAIDAIAAIDPRYHLAIVASKEPGMYRLDAHRNRGNEVHDGSASRGDEVRLLGAMRSGTPDQKGGLPSYVLPSYVLPSEVHTFVDGDHLARAHTRGRSPSLSETGDDGARDPGRSLYVEALEARGIRATVKVRAMVAEMATRYGEEGLADLIRDTPGDPLAHLKALDAERRATVAAEERDLAERVRAARRRVPSPPADAPDPRRADPERWARLQAEARQVIAAGVEADMADRLRREYDL